MPKSGVVPDVQILAKEDKWEEWLQLPLKANRPDEPAHGDFALGASGPAHHFDPSKVAFMRNSTSSLNQHRCIHVKVFTAMEITQETDAAEQIADEMFKR